MHKRCVSSKTLYRRCVFTGNTALVTAAYKEDPVRAANLGLAIGVWALCLGMMGVITATRHTFTMKSAAVTMMHLINGSGLLFGSSIVANYLAPAAATCWLTPVFFHLGMAVMFAPLLTKIYRVSRIFRTMKETEQLTDAQTFRLMASVVSVCATFLLMWMLAAPPTLETEVWVEALGAFTYSKCAYPGQLSLVMMFFEMALLLGGCVVSFQGRHNPSNFTDAKAVGNTIYTTVGLGLVAGLMLGLVELRPEYYALLQSLLIGLLYVNMQVFIFFPKVCVILSGGDDHQRKTTLMSASMRTSPSLSQKRPELEMHSQSSPSLLRPSEALRISASVDAAKVSATGSDR